jgi:hypothetical protein
MEKLVDEVHKDDTGIINNNYIENNNSEAPEELNNEPKKRFTFKFLDDKKNEEEQTESNKDEENKNQDIEDPVQMNNYTLKPDGPMIIDDIEFENKEYLDHEHEDIEIEDPSCCKYLMFGLIYRHLYFGALFRRNLFNPRYKRLTLLFCYVSLMMCLNAIFYTYDENASIVYISNIGRIDRWLHIINKIRGY